MLPTYVVNIRFGRSIADTVRFTNSFTYKTSQTVDDEELFSDRL